jgi:hypothetical protein
LTFLSLQWRFLSFFVLFTAEVSLVVDASLPRPLRHLLPSRLAFQQIDLLRQLWITVSLALNQLLPLWSPLVPGRSVEDPQVIAAIQQAVAMSRELEALALAAADEQLSLVGDRSASGNEIDYGKILKREMEQCE